MNGYVKFSFAGAKRHRQRYLSDVTLALFAGHEPTLMSFFQALRQKIVNAQPKWVFEKSNFSTFLALHTFLV